MATTFQIEKNVAPPPYRPGRAKYPFPEMDVGDSFLAPEDGNVRGSAYAYGALTGRKFTCSAVEGGIRVWRVA